MTSSKKAKAQSPRGIDSFIEKRIKNYCLTHGCPEQGLREIVQLALSPSAATALGSMALKDIKAAVALSWKHNTYQSLSKDKNWKAYHQGTGMNASKRETWEKYYREWVSLPDDEQNEPQGYGVINGIDIFKNFRPWEVFGVDNKTGGREDILKAYRRLSMKYHPDSGGDPAIFQQLTTMKDSLMALFD
jgi:hypothetical protein